MARSKNAATSRMLKISVQSEPDSALVAVPTGENALVSTPALRLLSEEARELVRGSKSPRTIAAYKKDWADFCLWCSDSSIQTLPASADAVAMYLTHLSHGLAVATIQRRISSIRQAHIAAGYESPTSSAQVRGVWGGIRRKLGTAQDAKTPILTDDLRRMLAVCADDLGGKRDRALLLLCFAGAFRRSELVSLDMADLRFVDQGLLVTLRRSKTDQAGAGAQIGITRGQHAETCPVAAVQAWIHAAGITSGPIFRSMNKHDGLRKGRLSGQSVALIVKRYAKAAGLEPAQYAGHSLRAGLPTSAAMGGADVRTIMERLRHTTETMTRRYIRIADAFENNATAKAGL